MERDRKEAAKRTLELMEASVLPPTVVYFEVSLDSLLGCPGVLDPHNRGVFLMDVERIVFFCCIHDGNLSSFLLDCDGGGLEWWWSGF